MKGRSDFSQSINPSLFERILYGKDLGITYIKVGMVIGPIYKGKIKVSNAYWIVLTKPLVNNRDATKGLESTLILGNRSRLQVLSAKLISMRVLLIPMLR